ncbi:myb-like protein X [Sesamum indicum]|uniref:Myb-like protein X n=1 Tax=Sesamum indicum TaxID=4182 RepID=A0A8M8V316_SESIN|nr:myb-like protein X [Sesamum indicum]
MNEQATLMNQQQQQPQPQLMNLNQSMMSMSQMNPQPQPQMVPMNRGYGMWPPPQQFQNLSSNPGAMKPPLSAFKKSLGPRSNWKGKKPPTLNELQQQNRLKTRKFFPRKKFNKNNSVNVNTGAGNNNYNNSRSAPFAPRNTTSFIIRAKKSGGIASLVSPSPMTPAVLPTPIFSPSREVLVDMAKEEWGVDGYGSMKGLIRLRSSGHEMEAHEDEDEDEGGSSESDVEEHVEVERRLDHDLSRFEMIYNPNSVNVGGMDYHNVLENRVDDQDTHIAQLEEENLILKERLFLMERELGDLRRRMQFLERRGNRGEVINEEVVENDSENESESHGEEAHLVEDNNEDSSEDNNMISDGCSKGKCNDGNDCEGFEAAETTEENVVFGVRKGLEDDNDDGLAEADNNDVTVVETKEENNNNELINENKAEEENDAVKDIEEKKNDKSLDVQVIAAINIDVGSSENGVAGDDICMEETGVAKDNMVSQSDVAN